MKQYALERAIMQMTESVAKARNRGMKHVALRVTEAEEVVAALCNKTVTGGEPVAPVPDTILNGLGWHDMKDCGACGNQLRMMANFCDVCGRAVKKGE